MKGKIYLQFYGTDEQIEYEYEANDTVQDILMSPNINPRSFQMSASDANENELRIDCPLREIPHDIIFLVPNIEILIEEGGDYEQIYQNFEYNQTVADMIAYYQGIFHNNFS